MGWRPVIEVRQGQVTGAVMSIVAGRRTGAVGGPSSGHRWGRVLRGRRTVDAEARARLHRFSCDWPCRPPNLLRPVRRSAYGIAAQVAHSVMGERYGLIGTACAALR